MLSDELARTSNDEVRLNLLYFIAAQEVKARLLASAIVPLMSVQNSVVRHRAKLTLYAILPEAIIETTNYSELIESTKVWPILQRQ